MQKLGGFSFVTMLRREGTIEGRVRANRQIKANTYCTTFFVLYTLAMTGDTSRPLDLNANVVVHFVSFFFFCLDTETNPNRKFGRTAASNGAPCSLIGLVRTTRDRSSEVMCRREGR